MFQNSHVTFNKYVPKMLSLSASGFSKYFTRNITLNKCSSIFKNSEKSWSIICRYNSTVGKSSDLTQRREMTDASSEGNKHSLEKDKLGQPGLNHGDHCMYPLVSGIERIRNGNLNKGLAFSLEERQILGIHGLLPPVIKTQEEQICKVKMNLDRLEDPLDKYMWLLDLMHRNEKLFYSTVRKYVAECLPLLYTPTVGTACVNWSKIYRWPRGMYITIHDRGHVYSMLKNWPEHDIRVIVFTDGERILGLGDLGACGMGIPIGKLCLYTALAGIKPHQCLPVTLDCGTNNEEFLKDPLYIGIREKRHRGPEYDELVDEFMSAVVQRWGQNTLLQFEDFGNSNAFRFLEKYRDKYCTFNDDIQGTASVTVAGILAALRITKNKFSDHTILFQGAGEANIGIAQLCVQAMVASGVSEDEAKKKIWLIDSKGLICKGRKEPIQSHKGVFAHEHKPMQNLLEIIKDIKPSILIGAAAIGGVFTSEILQVMAKNHKRPIIFALSNPTPKAECTPEQAYKETKGQVIYASGSPFPPVQYEGKTYVTGQSNNSYVFPGIGLAGVAGGIPHYTDEHFLTTAQALSELVTDEDLSVGRIYPPIESILEVSVGIATRLIEHSYQQCMATVYPEPEDKEAFVRAQMYSTDYEHSFPCPFEYPESATGESSC